MEGDRGQVGGEEEEEEEARKGFPKKTRRGFTRGGFTRGAWKVGAPNAVLPLASAAGDTSR